MDIFEWKIKYQFIIISFNYYFVNDDKKIEILHNNKIQNIIYFVFYFKHIMSKIILE